MTFPRRWNQNQCPSFLSELDTGTPLSANLLALWTFSNGQANDYSGTNNNGTVFAANTVASQIGTALNFTATANQYVLNNITVNIPYVTIAAYVNISAIPSSTARIGGFCQGYNNLTHDKELFITTSGYAGFYIYTSGVQNIYGTTNICDGKWHMIIGTYDGVNMNLYVDGLLVSTLATTGASYTGYSGPNIMVNGVTAAGSSTFTYLACQQSLFGVWSGALSSDKVMALSSKPFMILRPAVRRAYLGPNQTSNWFMF